jgi:hypothetical protein
MGSHGYETIDGNWLVNQGANYIKEDSCGGSPDHATAFKDYAMMRDVLNETGKQVFFSLCGWHEWYSRPDPALNFTGGVLILLTIFFSLTPRPPPPPPPPLTRKAGRSATLGGFTVTGRTGVH